MLRPAPAFALASGSAALDSSIDEMMKRRDVVGVLDMLAASSFELEVLFALM